MSFISAEEKYEENNEKSSDEITQEDSEESYQTEEEVLNKSFLESITKLESITIEKNRKNTESEIPKSKNRTCRLNVSVRYGKRHRFIKSIKKSQKINKKKNYKKTLIKNHNCLEKPVETLKKGKRCRVGGKAKGKPLDEENHDKHESDEDSENNFFSRISLGFFQKFKDLSGASTSNQWEENYKRPLQGFDNEKMNDEILEEMELLELQNWGRAKNEKLEKTEFLNPDTF